ncbi:MAG: hypothetical protein COV36_01775 [Alphaproteobacteria bacterium CG11_big_fil_rev_8_21_14_0_20_44_7]|nr:MAG: hypothetical protein COV36_01775 [Alphaproteobacteria bacterium CG11_big_fil_rev_8_21_14_0_20_44_7]
MTNSNNLGVTLLEQSQAQKEVTINEAIYVLEALQNRGVVDKDLATPPVSPSAGDAYIVAASATDDWAGHEDEIAYYNQSWQFIVPNEGLALWMNDEDKLYVYDGASWVSYADNLNNLEKLGINAAADSTNKLSVASDAVLFSHDGDDIQAKLNKASSGDTASFLFQDNFSGRAEFGLIGDDDFTLKVSADGSAWNDAFSVDNSGNVNFDQAINFGQTDLDYYEEGMWTPTIVGETTAGSPTYSVNAGIYSRIGKTVTVGGRISLTNLGGATGNIKISGLPFTISSSFFGGVAFGYANNLALSSGFDIVGHIPNGNASILLYQGNNAGASSRMTNSNINNTTNLYFSLTYIAA